MRTENPNPASPTKEMRAWIEREESRTAQFSKAFLALRGLAQRKRPLPRLSQRFLDLAPLLTGGLFIGPLTAPGGANVARQIRSLLRTGCIHSTGLTPLFDPDWYLRCYPDIRAAGVHPALHYLQHGYLEQRDPCPLVAGTWYATRNADVLDGRINPIAHYRLFGAAAGVDPHPLFQTNWYSERYGAQIPAGVTPLEYFLTIGWTQGHDPGPWFDTRYYLQRYSDQGLADPNPVVDYLIQGADLDRDPSSRFETKWYKEDNPDVVDAGLNPLFHFLAHGQFEDRQPLPPNRISIARGSKDSAHQHLERQKRASKSEEAQSGQETVPALLWPKSVLVVTERKAGATPFISFIQPLARYVESGGMKLQIERDNRRWDADDIAALLRKAQPDIVVLCRYVSERSRLFIECAKRFNIPLVFHIDDDLLDVPPSIGKEKYDSYQDSKRLESLRRALNASDLVYASTFALAQRLAEQEIDAPIVHGQVYCSVDCGDLPPVFPATMPVIGYMGTQSHSADLALIAPAIERLLDAVPAVSFETFGTIHPLPQLARFGNRVLHHPPLSNYEEFLAKLRSLGWWVGLAPLEDNIFNRCKADTKWVEYSYAGMPVVAQDIAVYRRACSGGSGVLASSVEEWYHATFALVRSAAAREALIRSARTKLYQSYSRSVLCDQVLNIFNEARSRHRGTAAAAG